MKLTAERVLDAMQRSSRSAHKTLHLLQLLELDVEAKPALKTLLKRLVADDALCELPGKRYALPRGAAPKRNSERSQAIQGRLHMNRRGFGFLQRDDGDDLYVHGTNLGDAMHGDQVEARLKRGPKGPEAVVTQVLSRGVSRFTGRLMRQGKTWLIQPDDERLRGPYKVIEMRDAPERGQVWFAEFARAPGEGGPGEVRLTRSLGVEGTRAAEEARVLLREAVREQFPEAVMEECAGISKRISKAERERRRDLRDLPLISIDPASARDHDDAIFAEQLDNGDFRVVVAIADVAHFVRKGTALDEEALLRAFSIYLPDRCIPMLPELLSADLASLMPKKERLCMGAELRLGSRGALKEVSLFEGVMRSQAKLTYEAAARTLGLTSEGPKDKTAEKFKPMLACLWQIARLLRKKRMQAGALTFDLPSPKVVFAADGEAENVVKSSSDPGVREAYHLVEEMMLLANTAVAETLTRAKRPLLYRVHGPPDSKKLERFIELGNALGYAMELEDLQDPKRLRAVLKRIQARPEHAELLSGLLLRAMQQATYDTTNVGHFGLANRCYAHFTSPIRRYPDLSLHREIKAWLREEPFAADKKQLDEAGREASRLERRAMVIERDVVDLYRCIVLKDRVGELFEARIGGLEEHGLYVTVDEPFVELRLPIEVLPKDEYRLSRTGALLKGQRTGLSFELGKRIMVKLQDVSLTERRCYAALPEEEVPKSAPSRKAQDVAVTRKRDDRPRRRSSSRGEAPRGAAGGERRRKGAAKPEAEGRGRGPSRGPSRGPGREPTRGDTARGGGGRSRRA